MLSNCKNEQFVDDDKDLDFHIRAIQNIIYTQKYNSQTATFEIKGSDLIGIIENNISKNKDRIWYHANTQKQYRYGNQQNNLMGLGLYCY